jgi:hypothetical protein
VQRGEPFGLDLTGDHQVALAQPMQAAQRLSSVEAASDALERVILRRFGDRDVLVASKEGMVVVLAPAHEVGTDAPSDTGQPIGDLGRLVHAELSQPALIDLVQSLLSPLDQVRGGARPLLDTLAAYFDSGCVAPWQRPTCICRCGR